MIRITRIYANHLKMGKEKREHVIEGGTIILNWTVECDDRDNAQRAYRITLHTGENRIWDSGVVPTQKQAASIDTSLFPAAEKIECHLTVWDRNEAQAAHAEEYFYIGSVKWHAPWISAPDTGLKKAVYFRREFIVSRPLRSACLYVCGIGYQKVTINGVAATMAYLDPPHTDYTRECQYVLFPDIQEMLTEGENCIGVVVGRGWRDNENFYALAQTEGHAARFIGPVQMTAMLCLSYADGTTEKIVSDGQWQAGEGMIAQNSLFGGETWDANASVAGWDMPGKAAFPAAQEITAPGGLLRPMSIPPIYAYETLHPVSVYQLRPGVWLYDMGRNIAGVPRIRLPKGERGCRLTLEATEVLLPDGRPDRHTIRAAAARDIYVYSGDERDAILWEPALTYHGFRYITIEGAWIEPERVEAIAFCTDLSSESSFSCGSALVNCIQKMIVDTERDNQHSVLTDCPQRDERMGWMNDATVRFDETVCNFYAAPMLKKVVRDIMQAQDRSGAITCTAPFVWGSCPADPVCSSFLLAAWLNYMHYGDAETMAQGYDAFCAWENCLLEHSDGFIVNYSYYGDWAAPDYACDKNTIGDGAGSKVTPGVLMSTGYSYMNCTLLAEMSRILGRGDEAKWRRLADQIRMAMVEKWYDAQEHMFGTDSMACLAFALWLDILPEAERSIVAGRLNDKLIGANYRFTSGNLCTRYLFEMLTRYGYVDTAWTLITREDYPSWGWMLQNGATTVWERFELKDASSMNSHNHPMYGAVGYWFYAWIAGVRPVEPGFKKVRIEPYFPEKLQHAQARLDTVQGLLYVRWIRKEKEIHLNVQVPFGMEAEISFCGSECTVGSGYHHFKFGG